MDKSILPDLGGRSRDRRRCKDVEFADEPPRRKSCRPYRNSDRLCLVETKYAPRRGLQLCNLDLMEIEFDTHSVSVREKGGHSYKISC